MDFDEMDDSKNSTPKRPPTPWPADTDWGTVPQAATVGQVGDKTIYAEIKAGRLRAARIGGRRDLRIHRDWIDQWLMASATPVEVRR